MNPTPFSKKCEIIEQAYHTFYGVESWGDFYINNDLGLPLAIACNRDIANVKSEGILIIEETWTELCNWLGIDSYGEYESLKEMYEFATEGE